MASIRRGLSPVPRPGSTINGEACNVASPLSKSSSCAQSYAPATGVVLSSVFGSLDYALYKVQTFVVGLLSKRSSRPLERSKLKGLIWRKALVQFFFCFVLGVFIGLTPFVSLNLSTNFMSKHQAFTFEVLHPEENARSYDISRNVTSTTEDLPIVENSTSEHNFVHVERKEQIAFNASFNQSLDQEMMAFRKLLIIVTPTETRPFQAYYLNRLAYALKLVPSPLLWIVVEVNPQSVETADLLRKTGVMYRHLVCSKNLTDAKEKHVHLRNVALSHIETHRLDGIVYFADEYNIYSASVFEQMRQISRFGTWIVARLAENNRQVILRGPICNGSQVIGWHTGRTTKRFQRFYAEISGFAFNSTILWDSKRWHRPTLEPIRQLDTARAGSQVSTFIEQVVEDESQMECLPLNCSGIMVWQFNTELLYPYPHEWLVKNNSSTGASFG